MTVIFSVWNVSVYYYAVLLYIDSLEISSGKWDKAEIFDWWFIFAKIVFLISIINNIRYFDNYHFNNFTQI